jgi:hypothetical protein
MGCFDYECECGGKTCVFRGGQDGGDSDVVIEVPLDDNTVVYIKGRYESYGAVHVGDYTFYPEQFSEYFGGWLESESDEARSKIFLAKRIWTISYTSYEYDNDTSHLKTSNCFMKDIPDETIITKIGKKTIGKCIRADKDLSILSDDEKQKQRIAKLKSTIEFMQQELGRINKP